MQPAAGVGSAARFQDASESDDAAQDAAQEGAPAAARAVGERADAALDDAGALQEEDFSSDDEDEAMLAEALDWDFREGARALAREGRVSRPD